MGQPPYVQEPHTLLLLDEIHDLRLDICLTITSHARTTGEGSAPTDPPYKFNPVQRLLAFLHTL